MTLLASCVHVLLPPVCIRKRESVCVLERERGQLIRSERECVRMSG